MNKCLSLLLALVFSLATIAPAVAMPKAAENESAQVTSGADAPKPKKTNANNTNPAQKKVAGKEKSVHKASHRKTQH